MQQIEPIAVAMVNREFEQSAQTVAILMTAYVIAKHDCSEIGPIKKINS